MIVQTSAWEPWSNVMADINFCNSMYLYQFILTENMTISFLRKTRFCLPVETSDCISRLFGVRSTLQVPQVPQKWKLGGGGLTIDFLPEKVPRVSCKSAMCWHTFTVARGDFTQQLPIPFDAQSPENLLAEEAEMSEFSCIILSGAPRSSTIVSTAINALITSLQRKHALHVLRVTAL